MSEYTCQEVVMHKPRRKMNIATMYETTAEAKRHLRELFARASVARNDTPGDRVARGTCTACHVHPGVCASVVTETECMSCGAEISSGASRVDVLCDACAREHELCRVCGGDLHGRVRRKTWPAPKKLEEQGDE